MLACPARTPGERMLEDYDPDADLLAALRRGEEAMFGRLVDSYHAALVRLAAHYVANTSIAEEVAQETWIAFVQGLDRFEGRSSLKTWLFRTLLNCARNRKRKEIRSVPFSAAFDPDAPAAVSVDSARFRTQGPWLGHWSIAPRSFEIDGENVLLQRELQARIARAIEGLAPAQREVINLRDIEGFSPEDACEVLGISEANQRVLLHRARSKVRAEVERYLHPETDQGA
jgi:RNA polymerase sigma-70 factor (ECF subfamily)